MKYPGKLNECDTVGIICPSSPITTDRIGECKTAIERMGYKVKTAGNLDTVYGGYMAGTGHVRGEWVNKMFADPEVRAIFCVRGGDGGSRAIEHVDFDLIRANPKIFVGYSDVTSLHNAINQKAGIVTFHGPMVSSNMVNHFDEETAESFFSVINAESESVFKNSSGFDIGTLRRGKAEGELTGGNLSLLSAGIGTPYEVDTKDKILFIEEVCEPMSKIEKWGFHLRNSGKLSQCRGIILGQFTRVANDSCPEFDELRTFEDILRGYDIPVMYNIQSGHGKPMMTLPLGALCRMNTAEKTIKFAVER